MNDQELKELSDKLREEAIEYYKMAKEFRRSSILKDKSENLLLNRNWMAKWKKYVDYQTVKESHHSYFSYSSYNKRVHKIDPESHPGEIDNKFFLYPLDEYLNDGNPENEENFVVKHDINNKTDLKIVNKNIWLFFYTRYGGGPQIEKPLIDNDSSSYNSNKVVEVFFRKVFKFIIHLFFFEKNEKIIFIIYLLKSKWLYFLTFFSIFFTHKKKIF